MLRSLATNSASKLTLGFIGLGQMGAPMAHNLASKTGHRILVFDALPSACQTLASQFPATVQVASSPAEIARESHAVFTMLPSSPHVRNVYLGDGGSSLLDGLKLRATDLPPALFLDSSTIDPKTSQTVASAIFASGHFAVDAPVSGGTGGAKAGTLTFMVGGRESDFEDSKLFLQHMGKSLVYCGPNGMGQVAKICNNMLLGISMMATAETMNLGCRLGMDPAVLSKIIASSSGRCWSIDTYNPVPGIMPNVPSSNGYKGGFAVELMTKDMNLASQAAMDSKSLNFLGGLTRSLYEKVCESHVQLADGSTEKLAGHDFSVVYKWMNDNARKGQ